MDELDRLWGLTLELSAQLTQNRAQCDALRQQADSLKQQAIHVGTGFTLRRFNVDISKEVFESELEKLNATIVCDNHSLQHENKQLTMLLKDYESTLENIMGRFRTFAHSTQMHELALIRHYEALVAAGGPSTADRSHSPLPPVEPDLSRLSTLLIKAMRATQGEDPSQPGTPTEGDIAKGGGYLALLGSLADGRDDALEGEIERERLHKENAELRCAISGAEYIRVDEAHRAMLGINGDLPAEPDDLLFRHTSPNLSATSPSLGPINASSEILAPSVPPPEGVVFGQPEPMLDLEESAIAD